MKKVWQIQGTKETHSSKQALKLVRDKLNKEAGFELISAMSDNGGNLGKATRLMPYKIIKGPDHPKRV